MVRRAIVAGTYLGAFALGLWLVRPFHSASIGPDAAAPVIEFQRLLAGQRLEGALSQTSKPLLTLLYGIAYGLAGDWRAVAILVVAAYAACVVCGGLLAYRVSGWFGAAFVAFGIAVSPALLTDISLAYGLTWAVLALLVAGLAVTAPRPRYAVAGAALAIGALARPEVMAVTGVAGAALVVGHLLARRGSTARPPREAWLLLLGFAAVPILALHDLALFGDPLFWAKTAQVNSASSGPVRAPLLVVRFVIGQVAALSPLSLLAIIGIAAQVLARQWAVAVGLVAATAGIALFWIAVGVRGVAIDTRYLQSIDVGVIVAAGIGIGSISVPAFAGVMARFEGGRASPLILVLVATLCFCALGPNWIFVSATRMSARVQIQLHANEARAVAAIRSALVAPPSWRSAPTGSVLVVVPPRLRAQIVVDLDLPLWAVAKSFGPAIALAKATPPPGAIIYHDRLDDASSAVFTQLEVDVPTVVGSVRLNPILVDRSAGIWVLRVETAPGT
ncbi:MAG: hypothetical protein QOE42_144 [Chloroflexota bacterium]|nr:hypothetical protein [Chloroflexota bacterium]